MELWKACTGPLLDVPTTGERVFYFPQGHMEQLEASTNQELNQRIPLFNLPSKILCRVLHIQLLVQLEPTSSWDLLHKDVHRPSKYTGMLQGFWRGNVPALLTVMPYTSIQFTVLHKFKTFVAGSSNAEDHIHLSPYMSYVSGAVAGCATTLGSYPFDLIRTILASQGEPKHEVYMPNLDFLEENDDEVDLTCHTLFLLVHC